MKTTRHQEHHTNHTVTSSLCGDKTTVREYEVPPANGQFTDKEDKSLSDNKDEIRNGGNLQQNPQYGRAYDMGSTTALHAERNRITDKVVMEEEEGDIDVATLTLTLDDDYDDDDYSIDDNAMGRHIPVDPLMYNLSYTMHRRDLLAVDAYLDTVAAITVPPEQFRKFLIVSKNILSLQSRILMCYRDQDLVATILKAFIQVTESSNNGSNLPLMIMDSGVFPLLAHEYMSRALSDYGAVLRQSNQTLAQLVSHLTSILAEHRSTHIMFTCLDLHCIVHSLEHSVNVLLSNADDNVLRTKTQEQQDKDKHILTDGGGCVFRPTVFANIVTNLLQALLCLASEHGQKKGEEDEREKNAEYEKETQDRKNQYGNGRWWGNRSRRVDKKDKKQEGNSSAHDIDLDEDELEMDVLKTMILSYAPQFDRVPLLLKRCLQVRVPTHHGTNIRLLSLQLLRHLLPYMPRQFEMRQIGVCLVPLMASSDLRVVQECVDLVMGMHSYRMNIQDDLRKSVVALLGRCMTTMGDRASDTQLKQRPTFECLGKLLSIDHCRHIALQMLVLDEQQEFEQEQVTAENIESWLESADSLRLLHREILRNDRLFRRLVLTYNNTITL